MNAQTQLKRTDRRSFLANGLMAIMGGGLLAGFSNNARAASGGQNHTLVLTVTDFLTRQPIKGARVTGYWDDGHNHTGPLPSAVTGDNGVAIISYKAATYWRISMTMTGYKVWSTTRIATEPRPDNLSARMRR